MASDQMTEQRSSYHHGDLRGALLRATQALIEEKGIDHFSVSDACRKAGVSTAAPYKHFKNKDEMVQATVLEAMLRHKNTLESDLAPHEKGSKERIVAMGRNYVEFALNEPGMFRLRFAQMDSPRPEIHENGQTIYGIVQDEVRAAMGEPDINDKVRERSYMLWSFVHGLSYLLMVPELAEKGGNTPLDDLLAEMCQRVLHD